MPVKNLAVPMHEVDGAITDGDETGFAKIRMRRRTNRTQAEAIRKAADAYMRARLTPTLRTLLRRWLLR